MTFYQCNTNIEHDKYFCLNSSYLVYKQNHMGRLYNQGGIYIYPCDFGVYNQHFAHNHKGQRIFRSYKLM